MKYSCLAIISLLSMSNSFGQSENLAAFDHLIGKTWVAEGTWENGSVFKQEVTFQFTLDDKLVLTKSKGFVDEKQTTFGDRNLGIRMYDSNSGSLRFWEFDVFGGMTTGTIDVSGKDIRYQYLYGENIAY